MRISISPDKLRAYLVFDSKNEPENIKLEDVLRLAEKKGVVYGLKVEEIKNFLENPDGRREILIAEGVPPVDGEDGYISYAFDNKLVKSVKEGDQLAVVYPPTKGADGMTVTGEIIKAKPGKPVENIYLGQNVAFADDGRTIIATADGCVVMGEDGTIEVTPVLKINGDIDANSEPISFSGSLIITGDIKSGARVSVKKNLEVYGNIEDAYVTVDGNAIIGGGFIGYGKGKLYVHGDASIKYIVNQNVVVDGNLVIRREAINANITCGGKIMAKDAVISGGTVMARESIEARAIGGAEYSKTIVIIGRRSRHVQKLKNVTNEISRLKEYLNGIKSEIYNLVKLKLEWGELPEEQERQLQNLMYWRDEIPKRLEQLENLRNKLISDMRKSHLAKLIVHGTIYKNTYLEINGAKEEITFNMKKSIFEEDMGIVVRTKIQEP